MKKEFLLIDVLHVVTNGNFSTRENNNAEEIVKFMIGKKELSLRQFERISEICRCYLVKRMPWLEKEEFSTMSCVDKFEWYKNYVEKNGEFVEIQSICPKVQELVFDDVKHL